MGITSRNQSLFRRIPLRSILIVPFVALVSGTVTLIGLLSFQSGQQAVLDVADQLRNEISFRIEEDLHRFFAVPHRVNQVNRDAVQQGLIDIDQPSSWREYLLNQAAIFTSVSNIAVGNAKGDYFGIDTPASGPLLQQADQSTGSRLKMSAASPEGGKPTHPLSTAVYDPRLRPWYTVAAGSGKPQWSTVYKHFADPVLQIALSMPVLDDHNTLRGVLTAAVRLSHITAYLQKLEIASSGLTYIIDREGLLIGTSTGEPTFTVGADGVLRRLSADASDNGVIRQTFVDLRRQIKDFANLTSRAKLASTCFKQRQCLVQVAPFRDEFGLDWRIVVVIPKDDLLATIHQNVQITVLLCALALLVSVVAAILTANWLVRPISQLSAAARDLTEGRQMKALPVDRADELGSLARSFATMAATLQATLQRLRRELDERRRTELALRESRELMTKTTDNAPCLIYQFLLRPDGSICFPFASSWSWRVFGVDPETLRRDGRPAIDLILPEDRPGFEASVAASAATMEFWQWEGRLMKASGEIVWCQGISKPERQADGAILWSGIFFDVSERKEAEAALQQSEQKYRVVVENAGEAIFILQNGYICFANAKTEEMTGIASADLLTRPFADFLAEEDRPRFLACQHPGHNRQERSTNALYRLAGDRDQPPRWVEISQVSILWNGVSATLNFMADKTEFQLAMSAREKLQEQLLQSQKMESIGRLAGGVAHDFNNMLGVIIGHCELALARVEPEHHLAGQLEEILKAARRSADLTRQLLAFARRQTVMPKVLDLNRAVESTITMLRRLIGEDITLDWRPAPNLRSIRIDPSQLDQVLTNLCINARDAIDGVGTITIETAGMTMAEHDSGSWDMMAGEYVLIRVSDTGCGITPENQARLFEPFFTTKETGKGTGLGLAMVYGIVKQNDGYIEVDSETGRGTTFTLFLPAVTAGSPSIVQQPQVEPAADLTGTVLLVEDEPAILGMVSAMLDREGFTVLVADGPKRAIEIASTYPSPIDLLITDVIMPEMNGKELASRLLQFQPAMKRLFMSGYTADVIAHHGVLEEGVHFIQKPFSLQALQNTLREVMH